MENRVEEIILGVDTRDDIKYLIDSAHDDNISNMIMWLNPINYELVDVAYASPIHFELHYDSECLDK